MIADQYLQMVIKKYAVTQGLMSTVLSTAKQLYPRIMIWGKILGGVNKTKPVVGSRGYIRTIYPTGSFAKKTNIVGATDLDLFISLSHSTPGTLESIYNNLSSYLKLWGFSPRKQNVSIGINYEDLSIDLVPGRKQRGATNDHSIYKRKAGTWTQTNVRKHILHVRKSGKRNEIRAIKIWRELHGLEFPSFYLELSVMEALKRRLAGRLSKNLQRVFEYLASNFENSRIIDPANSNNIISDDLTAKEKEKIAEMAYESLYESYWHNVIW